MITIRRILAAYFSPTGTTEKAVSTLADELARISGCKNTEKYDFTLPPFRNGFPKTREEDLVIFGVPTYAGRVPNVLLKYLDTIYSDGALAIPLVTFGNRAFDNSLKELRNILSGAGFKPFAAAAVSCEHSFSYTLGAGRPDEEDLLQLRRFASRVIQCLTDKSAISGTVKVPGNLGDQTGYYKPRDAKGAHIDIRKVKPRVDPANCIGCGLCAAVCPMGSISPDDINKMTGICIKCGACIKKCPASARFFDDAGYLYHKTELEKNFARRADNSFFI